MGGVVRPGLGWDVKSRVLMGNVTRVEIGPISTRVWMGCVRLGLASCLYGQTWCSMGCEE